jgi:hypothetical protein
MKNIFLLLLMLAMPIQSLCAAGQSYHMLEEGYASGSVVVVHNHVHHDSHEHYQSTGDSVSESDHHHHCAGHCAVVLPSPLTDLQPDLRYDELFPEPLMATSLLQSRIERPNWC